MQFVIDNSLIAFLPVPIIFFDDTLTIGAASHATSAVFGRRCFLESPDRNMAELNSFLKQSAEFCNLLKTTVEKARASGTIAKFRWQNNRRIYNVNVSMLPISGAAVFSAWFEDNSDYVVMAQLNDSARGYLESIMSSLPLGIIVVDRDLSITHMNRAQERIFTEISGRVSLIHVVGQPLAELFPDELPLLEQVKQDVLESGVVFGGIVERFDAGDKEKSFAISFSPLHDGSNKIVGMLRACEDITEKEKLEANLHEAERRNLQVDAIKKVIITLNHEINNALLSITANAELLLRASAKPEDKSVLESIVTCADKIADVTKQLGALKEIKTREYLKGGPEMIDTAI